MLCVALDVAAVVDVNCLFINISTGSQLYQLSCMAYLCLCDYIEQQIRVAFGDIKANKLYMKVIGSVVFAYATAEYVRFLECKNLL
jgi:hypothetical protein